MVREEGFLCLSPLLPTQPPPSLTLFLSYPSPRPPLLCSNFGKCGGLLGRFFLLLCENRYQSSRIVFLLVWKRAWLGVAGRGENHFLAEALQIQLLSIEMSSPDKQKQTEQKLWREWVTDDGNEANTWKFVKFLSLWRGAPWSNVDYFYACVAFLQCHFLALFSRLPLFHTPLSLSLRNISSDFLLFL